MPRQAVPRIEQLVQHLVAVSTDDPNVVKPTEHETSMAAELAMNGFVHIKGVCEPAEVAELVGAIDTTAIDDQCGDLDAAGIKSLRNPWNRSMLFVGYLDRDPVAVVAEQALGSGSGPGGGASPPEHNHVVSMVATRAKPGAPASDDGLHLDFLPIEVDSDLLASGEIEMPMFITTAVYCLTAGPAEIGVVAGSHLAGRAPKPQEQTFNGTGPTRLQVEAGDVIMFRCESWKCVFANEVRLPLGPDCVSLPIQLGCQCTLLNTFHTGSQSATPRHALRVHYSQPHIGHRFQPYVNQGGETGFQFNPDIVSKLNPRQRRMLGEHPHYGYD